MGAEIPDGGIDGEADEEVELRGPAAKRERSEEQGGDKDQNGKAEGRKQIRRNVKCGGARDPWQAFGSTEEIEAVPAGREVVHYRDGDPQSRR